MTRTKRRSQKRLPKGVKRQPLPACVLDRIYEKVDAEAKRFNVSRSFVIAVALATVFNVKEQEEY